MDTGSNIPGPTEQPNIPQGWYPDGSGALRWWDGSQWTEHVHNEQPAAPLQPAPQQAAPQQTGPHDSYAVATPPKTRNRWLIPVIAGGAALLLVAVVSTGFLVARGLKTVALDSPTVEAPRESPDVQIEPDEYDFGEDAETDGFADVFAEQQQFFKDQQLPLDGSLLKAVTPEQKEFIAELKQEYEDSDLVFTDTEESVALAIAADACETSILSQHMIEQYSVRGFVLTSPLITELVGNSTGEARAGTINGIMRIAVKGTGYMCPADHQQWADGFESIDGAW